MKRICIIGNSHAACWLAAWRANRERFDKLATVRFFVLGGYDAARFVDREGRLVIDRADLQAALVQTSEGLSYIAPDDYDVFVVVSLTSGFKNLTGLFAQYGLADGPFQPAGLTYLSRSCLSECAEGLLAQSHAIALINTLKRVSDKPVILSPSPCLSETALLLRDALFADLCKDGRQQYLFSLFEQSVGAVAARHGVRVLFQDPTTMIPGGAYTRALYSRRGINSKMKIADTTDIGHMNAEFGAIELENALALSRCL